MLHVGVHTSMASNKSYCPYMVITGFSLKSLSFDVVVKMIVYFDVDGKETTILFHSGYIIG